MKNIFKFMTLLILLLVAFLKYYRSPSVCGDASVIHLENYEDLSVECSKRTLVTFDVDGTIIMPQNPDALPYGFFGLPLWFQLYGMIRHPSIIWNYEHITSLIFAYSPQVLVKPIVTDIIKMYKKRCTVLGLTSIESGSWGIIKNMPEWRYAMLHSMGIQFSSVADKTFTQLTKRRGTYPVLYKGILCTNQQQKGKVLGAYIDSLRRKPRHVISFDNNVAALCSIGRACKERAIHCTLYHYTGANDRVKFDFTRASAELDMLMHQAVR